MFKHKLISLSAINIFISAVLSFRDWLFVVQLIIVCNLGQLLSQFFFCLFVYPTIVARLGIRPGFELSQFFLSKFGDIRHVVKSSASIIESFPKFFLTISRSQIERVNNFSSFFADRQNKRFIFAAGAIFKWI